MPFCRPFAASGRVGGRRSFSPFGCGCLGSMADNNKKEGRPLAADLPTQGLHRANYTYLGSNVWHHASHIIYLLCIPYLGTLITFLLQLSHLRSILKSCNRLALAPRPSSQHLTTIPPRLSWLLVQASRPQRSPETFSRAERAPQIGGDGPLRQDRQVGTARELVHHR